MLASKLLSAAGSTTDTLYSDDVFSAYTYTGNGSTQTINNGIDLAGKGGMVWIKSRLNTSTQHTLTDTTRGASKNIYANLTNTEDTFASVLTSFNASSFSLGVGIGNTNSSAQSYISHTFRKAPKFFDVVTYTGNGVAGRQIPHELGIAPGMVIIKATSNTTNWAANHSSLAAGNYMKFNDTSPATYSTSAFFGTHSSSSFQVGSDFDVNASGYTYVAYLFAHDPSADGIIQCGSFNSSAGAIVAQQNLGWEPQYILIKRTNNAASGWYIHDTARGLYESGYPNYLLANSSGAESGGGFQFSINATGFRVTGGTGANDTFIYLAIRRPNKPPTTGTEVYKGISRTGDNINPSPITGVGFAPDLVNIQSRISLAGGYPAYWDRLRGPNKLLKSSATDEELSSDSVTSFNQDGVSLSDWALVNSNQYIYINHFFRRAPGFFDVVCYTGTGVTGQAFNHNLQAIPELILVKGRGQVTNWGVYTATFGVGNFLRLNQTAANALESAAIVPNALWGGITPTASSFYTGVEGYGSNNSGQTYVAYLFASLPGISKVGSYTGNGTTQTINCGFTTGARFFLVKATSTTGSWWVFDSTRGIISAADPALQLNSTAAEITSADAVDPDVSGLVVNQEATCSINATGVSYIYLAVA